MLLAEPPVAVADRTRFAFDPGVLSDADAAVALPDGGVYVFSGESVRRYDTLTGRLDPEYPAPIARVFPGAFPRGVNAALLHPDGSLYLFRGQQHMRYDLQARRPAPGYPRSYAADWPGVFSDGIDAAVTWAPDIIYFFARDAYTSFSPARNAIRAGFPKSIIANWPGVPAGPVRAAVVLNGDRRALVSAGRVHVMDREGVVLEGEEHVAPPAAAVACEVLQLGRRCRLGRLQHGTAETFVLIPDGGQSPGGAPVAIDVLLHFHGFGAGYHVLRRGERDYAGVLAPGERRDIDLYHLDSQLDAVSRRNGRLTIAVLPQGSAYSRFDAVPGRPDAFLDEVLNALTTGGVWTSAPVVDNVVISGHSGGGPSARSAAEHLKSGFRTGGSTSSAHLAGLVLFDAVQGEAEAEAAQSWVRDEIRANARALLSITSDGDVDTYLARRARFRGYTSPGGYTQRYKSLSHTIESEIRLAQTRGLAEYAAVRLREQYQVIGPIGSSSSHNGYYAHEHLIGGTHDPSKPGIVYEALEGLGATPIQTNPPQHEIFNLSTVLEAEAKNAPPAIARRKAPRAVPPSQPIEFAPEPPSGSYWPIWTTVHEGRLVSYEANDGTEIGYSGRKFLAGRKTQHSGAINRWHVGIDLFARRGDPVVACEDGEIIFFHGFTPAQFGHGPTNQLLIAHSGCVINYGEVTPDSLTANGLHVHDRVKAGQRIGSIGDTAMLHFETYRAGVTHNLQWMMNQPHPPAGLLNPTRYLLYLQELGLDGSSAPQRTPTTSGDGSFTSKLQDALNAGEWTLALTLAIMSGNRDENALTDMLFYARHRELSGRRLGPGDTKLAAEWRSIRDGIVRPVLAKSPAGTTLTPPAPPVSPPPVPPPASTSVLDPTRWAPLVRATLSKNGGLTQSNAVLSLIDGPDTYRQMVAAMQTATGPGHFIYLLGWTVHDSFPLLNDNQSVTLLSVLETAARSGVQVRVLAWDDRPNKPNALPASIAILGGGLVYTYIARKAFPNANTPAVQHIDKLPGAAARLDNETLQLGSHHQKLLIVNGSQGLVAFCGGVDFNPDRIQPTPGDGSAYHDVHCRVVGPAAWDLLQTFIRRWNYHPDHTEIDSRIEGLRGLQLSPPTARQTPLLGGESNVPGTCSVAVARTFVSRRLSTPSEQDIKAMFLMSIANARRFIYIEDQYLVDLDAADALRQALPRLQHVTILVAPSEQVSDMLCIWTYRRNFIDQATKGLSQADRAKLRIFRLVSPPLVAGQPSLGEHTYVHAKTWCFDDEIAAIGSANVDRRGWETDSEIDAFIFDDQRPAPGALTFAQDLRCRLWAEHLGVSPAVVQDGVTSAGLWLNRPSTARVVPYDPSAGDDSKLVSALDVVVGPLGNLLTNPGHSWTCDKLRDLVDPGLSS